MTDISVKEAGKLGGNKTLAKHGREHFKRISQMGVKARQGKRDAITPKTREEK